MLYPKLHKILKYGTKLLYCHGPFKRGVAINLGPPRVIYKHNLSFFSESKQLKKIIKSKLSVKKSG